MVQARYASHRLPGKVVRPMLGRPMLGHLLEALATCRTLDGIVVATSTGEEDDPVAACARSAGVALHRGPLNDVAGRLLEAAQAMRADALVRISGDSPLLDPVLVDTAGALFRDSAADLVSNVVERSFPKGQSVEVIRLEALRRACRLMTSDHDREHVTTFLYGHPELFSIRGFTAARPRPDLQLSVDTDADFLRCEAILAALGRPAWQAGWEACVRAYDAVTETAPR